MTELLRLNCADCRTVIYAAHVAPGAWTHPTIQAACRAAGDAHIPRCATYATWERFAAAARIQTGSFVPSTVCRPN